MLPGVRHLRLPTLTPLKGKQPAVQLRGHLVACVNVSACAEHCVLMRTHQWKCLTEWDCVQMFVLQILRSQMLRLSPSSGIRNFIEVNHMNADQVNHEVSVSVS